MFTSWAFAHLKKTFAAWKIFFESRQQLKNLEAWLYVCDTYVETTNKLNLPILLFLTSLCVYARAHV
jgi:hypothetical protein